VVQFEFPQGWRQSTVLWDTWFMKAPNLIVTNFIGGQPQAWKCPACRETFDLSPYPGTPQEKIDQMVAAYEKHFKDRHGKEDASQAAARIVREATENH
jgi:hypothetical protein